MHQNEEKNSELGVHDLLKLKKRLFDPEFQLIENRYKQRCEDVKADLIERMDKFEARIRLDMQERQSFIESFQGSIE